MWPGDGTWKGRDVGVSMSLFVLHVICFSKGHFMPRKFKKRGASVSRVKYTLIAVMRALASDENSKMNQRQENAFCWTTVALQWTISRHVILTESLSFLARRFSASCCTTLPTSWPYVIKCVKLPDTSILLCSTIAHEWRAVRGYQQRWGWFPVLFSRWNVSM